MNPDSLPTSVKQNIEEKVATPTEMHKHKSMEEFVEDMKHKHPKAEELKEPEVPVPSQELEDKAILEQYFEEPEQVLRISNRRDDQEILH